MKIKNILFMGAIVVGGMALNAHAVISKDAILNKAELKAKRSLEPEAVPGEFVVKLRVSGLSTLSQSVKTLAKFGLQMEQVINAGENLVLVKSNQAQLMSLGTQQHVKIMNAVSQLSEVEFIEPNFIYRAFDLPTRMPSVVIHI